MDKVKEGEMCGDTRERELSVCLGLYCDHNHLKNIIFILQFALISREIKDKIDRYLQDGITLK